MTARNVVSDIFVHIIWLFGHVLIFAGMGLITHDVLVSHHLMPEILAEWFVKKVGSIFATLALFFVSISIYFENRPRTSPTQMTRIFSAPVMIILALTMFIAFLIDGSLSGEIIDGLSAIALGGSMLRMTGVPLRFPVDVSTRAPDKDNS